MDRKNLIGLMAAAVAAVLCGYASAATPPRAGDVPPEATAAPGTARNAWLACLQAAIPRLDDSQSPSEVVARAAMKGCADQYANMMRAVTTKLAPTCGRDSDCVHRATATAEREAIKSAIDEVMAARVRVAGATILKCE